MDLIQKATKLGYEHYTEFTIEELDNLSLADTNKQIEYFIIQRWLREKHNIHIEIYHFTEMDWWFMLWKLPTEYNDEPLWTDEGFDTYELALEAGLLEGLKLIK